MSTKVCSLPAWGQGWRWGKYEITVQVHTICQPTCVLFPELPQANEGKYDGTQPSASLKKCLDSPQRGVWSQKGRQRGAMRCSMRRTGLLSREPGFETPVMDAVAKIPRLGPHDGAGWPRVWRKKEESLRICGRLPPMASSASAIDHLGFDDSAMTAVPAADRPIGWVQVLAGCPPWLGAAATVADTVLFRVAGSAIDLATRCRK